MPVFSLSQGDPRTSKRLRICSAFWAELDETRIDVKSMMPLDDGVACSRMSTVGELCGLSGNSNKLGGAAGRIFPIAEFFVELAGSAREISWRINFVSVVKMQIVGETRATAAIGPTLAFPTSSRSPLLPLTELLASIWSCLAGSEGKGSKLVQLKQWRT
jgi:hypothetical protein